MISEIEIATEKENDIAIGDLLDSLGDAELEALQTKYCQKTGSPCGIIAISEILQLVKIHGRERSITILKATQKCVNPEWIITDSEALANLAHHRPREYFIYASTTLLFPAETEKGKDAQFAKKVTAWQNLQTFESDVLRPISELVRRILAKCPPSALGKVLAKAGYTGIDKITSNLAMLTQFQINLQKILRYVIDNESKLSDAGQIGMLQFKLQGRSVPLTSLETEVFNEFNDFEIIPDKKPDAIEAITGRSYGKSHKLSATKQKAPKFAGKVITNPQFTGLKFGGGK